MGRMVPAMTPDTFTGWAALTLTVLSIIVLVAGVIAKLAKQHIDHRITEALTEKVHETVTDALHPIEVHLEAMRLQMVTHGGELERVRELEKTVKNGLSHRTARIEDKVDRLLEAHHWNGDERRRHD